MGGDGEDRGNEIGHNLIIVETRKWVPEGPLSHSFLHVETFHKEVCSFLFFFLMEQDSLCFLGFKQGSVLFVILGSKYAFA